MKKRTSCLLVFSFVAESRSTFCTEVLGKHFEMRLGSSPVSAECQINMSFSCEQSSSAPSETILSAEISRIPSRVGKLPRLYFQSKAPLCTTVTNVGLLWINVHPHSVFIYCFHVCLFAAHGDRAGQQALCADRMHHCFSFFPPNKECLVFLRRVYRTVHRRHSGTNARPTRRLCDGKTQKKSSVSIPGGGR